MSSISNKAISDYLGEKGIYHSRLGYKYLMLSLRAMLDGKVDRYCMKSVFEHVAVETGVKAAQVDLAIRRAIRKTEHAVTNKEFLTRAFDELSLSADADAPIFVQASNPANAPASG